MKVQAKHYLSALAVLILAAPLFARNYSARLSVTDTTTIGATQLKPGDYDLQAKDNDKQLKVVDPDTGKTVAEVPVQWIELKQKPATSQVVVSNNQVTEVDFGGKTQAVQIAGSDKTSGN